MYTINIFISVTDATNMQRTEFRLTNTSQKAGQKIKYYRRLENWKSYDHVSDKDGKL